MSESDSFVGEVSEEIRRDRLYHYAKKYGWIVGLILALIVGGAIYNEWRKASLEAQRQATGDALLSAIEQQDPERQLDALTTLSDDGGSAAVLSALARAGALAETGRTEDAIAAYNTVAERGDISEVYKDLALLKGLMLSPDGPDADQTIEYLAAPGRPFSLLAIEIRALNHVRTGDTDAALADLTAILEAPQTTAQLRQRAQQLTIVLGGEVPQSAVLVPSDDDNG